MRINSWPAEDSWKFSVNLWSSLWSCLIIVGSFTDKLFLLLVMLDLVNARVTLQLFYISFTVTWSSGVLKLSCTLSFWYYFWFLNYRDGGKGELRDVKLKPSFGVWAKLGSVLYLRSSQMKNASSVMKNTAMMIKWLNLTAMKNTSFMPNALNNGSNRERTLALSAEHLLLMRITPN
jgi:hypothetical protein